MERSLALRSVVAIPSHEMYCTLQYIVSHERVYAVPSEIAKFKRLALNAQAVIPLSTRGSAMSSEAKSESTISIVNSDQLSAETSQTSGSQRMSAISGAHGIASKLWAGTFLVAPSAKTGIHHHGEQDTVVFVLEGEAVVRWGNCGEHRAAVREGDFLHVPSWLPHQELNPSMTTPFRWIVVRSTPEPIVVNLPADFWGR
jgi:uncharacterized RmlC-like cupin family protein